MGRERALPGRAPCAGHRGSLGRGLGGRWRTGVPSKRELLLLFRLLCPRPEVGNEAILSLQQGRVPPKGENLMHPHAPTLRPNPRPGRQPADLSLNRNGVKRRFFGKSLRCGTESVYAESNGGSPAHILPLCPSACVAGGLGGPDAGSSCSQNLERNRSPGLPRPFFPFW